MFDSRYMDDVIYNAETFWERDLGLVPTFPTPDSSPSFWVCCDLMSACTDDSVYGHAFFDEDFRLGAR